MNYIRCLGNNLVHWRNLSKESKCLKMILARGVLLYKRPRKRDKGKPKGICGAPCSEEEMMEDSILRGE